MTWQAWMVGRFLQPCGCPPSRGQIINRRAYVGSQIVTLRVRIPELEKLSRRTPPRSLFSERMRVEQAKTRLAAERVRLAKFEKEYEQLMRAETQE